MSSLIFERERERERERSVTVYLRRKTSDWLITTIVPVRSSTLRRTLYKWRPFYAISDATAIAKHLNLEMYARRTPRISKTADFSTNNALSTSFIPALFSIIIPHNITVLVFTARRYAGVHRPAAGAVLPAVNDRTEGVPHRWCTCLERSSL